MIATAELIKMRRLAPNSIEGVLAMLASLVLTLPLQNYLTFLPTDGNYTAYAIVVFLLLGATVFNYWSIQLFRRSLSNCLKLLCGELASIAWYWLEMDGLNKVFLPSVWLGYGYRRFT